jgi:hypothetical protein
MWSPVPRRRRPGPATLALLAMAAVLVGGTPGTTPATEALCRAGAGACSDDSLPAEQEAKSGGVGGVGGVEGGGVGAGGGGESFGAAGDGRHLHHSPSGTLSIELRFRHVVGMLLIVSCFLIGTLVTRFLRMKNKVVVEIGAANRATVQPAPSGSLALLQRFGGAAASRKASLAAAATTPPAYWFLQPLTVFIVGGGWPSGWLFLVPARTAPSPSSLSSSSSSSSSSPFMAPAARSPFPAPPAPPLVGAELDRFKLLFCAQEFFGQSFRKNYSTINIPQRPLLDCLLNVFGRELDAIEQHMMGFAGGGLSSASASSSSSSSAPLPVLPAAGASRDGAAAVMSAAARRAAKKAPSSSSSSAGGASPDNVPVFTPAQAQFLASQAFELWCVRAFAAADAAAVAVVVVERSAGLACVSCLQSASAHNCPAPPPPRPPTRTCMHAILSDPRDRYIRCAKRDDLAAVATACRACWRVAA